MAGRRKYENGSHRKNIVISEENNKFLEDIVKQGYYESESAIINMLIDQIRKKFKLK